MGADLILAWVPWPRYTDGKYVMGWDEIVDEVGDRLRACTPDDIHSAGLWRECDDNEVYDVALSLIEELIKDVDSREITIIVFGEREYLFTGGMTGGDDPTEAYEIVQVLQNLCLFEKDFSRDYLKQVVLGEEP